MNLSNKKYVAKLVADCIKGNNASQQKLYKAFYGKMLVLCMRYTSNKQEAQDLLHEGYLKVFIKLNSFNNKGSLEGWIRRIIVNNAIDFVRKKKDVFFINEEESNLSNIKDDSYEESDLDSLAELKAETILKLVQKLSPAYKTVFSMYIIEGYKHKEIAEELGISVGTSKSNLAKAKANIIEMIKEISIEDEY